MASLEILHFMFPVSTEIGAIRGHRENSTFLSFFLKPCQRLSCSVSVRMHLHSSTDCVVTLTPDDKADQGAQGQLRGSGSQNSFWLPSDNIHLQILLLQWQTWTRFLCAYVIVTGLHLPRNCDQLQQNCSR